MQIRQGNANTILEQIAAQPLAPVETQVPAAAPTQVAPVETPAAPTPPVVETPVATPPVTPAPVAQEPVAPAPSGLIEDWDATPAPVVESTPTLNFEEIGKAIGIKGIKTKEDLETRIKAAQSKPEPDFTGVPDNLQKAIKLAKEGADYLQYLKVNSVDYSQIDPVSIYENWVKNQFVGQDGKPDEAKASDYLASRTPIEKELEGMKLKNEYINYQRSQEESLIREAQAKKQLADMKLREALDKVNDISGFKIKPEAKQETFDRITTGKFQKDLFYNEKGEFDYEKMVKVDFVVKNFDKITKYLSDRAKTSQTRAIVNDLQNVQVNTPSEKPTADPGKQDVIMNWINEMRK